MSDDFDSIVEKIENEYDADSGFLGLLRYRTFDPLARDRFLDLLRSIDLGDAEAVDRRLVRVLWMVPIFMSWQDRNFTGDELEAARDAQDLVLNEMQRIFGVP